MSKPQRPLFFLLSIFLILLTVSVKRIESLAVINVCSLLLLNFAIIKIQKAFFTPFVLVGGCFYLFNSGHLWMSLFHRDAYSFIASFDYVTNTEEAIYMYGLLTVLLIVYYSCGILFIKPVTTVKAESLSVSWLFRAIVIILYILSFYFEVERAESVAIRGYALGYHYSNSFANMLSDCMDLLLLITIYAYRDDKNYLWRYVALLLFRALFVMFLVGNRGSSVINILVAVFVITHFSYLSSNIAFKRRLMIVVSLFFLIALPTISLLRNSAEQEISIWESFFIEFGDTARNAFLSNEFVSSVGSLKGMQLLTTSLTIFPFSGFFMGDLISRYGFVGDILNTYNNTQGLGGSLIAQLLINFDVSVPLFLSWVLVACLCVFISNRLMTKSMSVFGVMIILGLLEGVITAVRGEVYSLMSNLKISLYLTLLLYICNANGISVMSIKKSGK